MNNDIFIQELIFRIDVLTKQVNRLESEVTALRKENNVLKERLAKHETPKNSNNSSVPPSKDENRPMRKSLREKTGRKPGGQEGRKGTTLKMVENPNNVITHQPNYCKNCGKDISTSSAVFVGKRQVIDIPPIKLIVTEHQVFEKTCSCGCTTTSSFPIEANAPVSYGNNIESLVGYFHSRQYLPFKRMQEMFNDVFHIPISEGGLHYLLDKLVRKAEFSYELIRKRLVSKTGQSIGSDETGVKVGGKKHWAWTWQNEEATFITITDNRGNRSIEDNFEKGFVGSILVHDCWRSHFNTPAMAHQICIAHLLRDTNYLTERYKHNWSEKIKDLLKESIELKSTMTAADYYGQPPERLKIIEKFQLLLAQEIPIQHKELVTFQKRLIRYQNFVFTFLYNQKVPPDNNASERAIRNIKVKQKVSGQFGSIEGAFRFAVLRSVTDTVLKNKQNVIGALKLIANFSTD